MDLIVKNNGDSNTVTEEKSDTPITPQSHGNYTSVSSVGSLTGVIVPTIQADLEKVLVDSNFPGEDYLELRDAIKGMANVGLDSTTALKAAFATLISRGLSKDIAIKTAKDYITILNNEKEKFYGAITSKIKSDVEQPEKEITQLSEENNNLSKQIQEITERIGQNNESISKKKVEITEAQNLIERTKINYDFTHNHCVKEIEDDIQKIQTLIS